MRKMMTKKAILSSIKDVKKLMEEDRKSSYLKGYLHAFYLVLGIEKEDPMRAGEE